MTAHMPTPTMVEISSESPCAKGIRAVGGVEV